MSKRNPEYDFKWCPGCGDFGVRRAIEFAMIDRLENTDLPIENNVVVAGIGCSGNLVHLLEGQQPYGIHGIHGRSLPIAFGVKMANPELNVIVVAGDGDFLSIGGEHIGPQAARNLNICAVVMDNGVYGLTKGQSSPTSKSGAITSSTPFGKIEAQADPLQLYLTHGATFVASGFSGQPRELAQLITRGMNHPGFAMVHVQSPCTTYNDFFMEMKGDAKNGIAPLVQPIPEEHDASNIDAAFELIQKPGVPIGVIYEDSNVATLDQKVVDMRSKARVRDADALLGDFEF
ncbi:MAG: 2-oxoacid:ferredoxin oxidoreductase subunit beta [SAR202 cluster bacterium]|jgi:2-oxoglutarate ferredoxin oxidoreductase subunit beta|nr:thiamine pyrophosphate-dependent enzyme [Dehalococcoidia bacterium]MQG17695.1 2-oxoacid:ferredoxin oxidoreductase subunit beta [SAR202 cluster bacterium]CAI8273949.1 MAG: 2-oxoglutarate oxidoreductase subunit KorB [Chloroflexota bacterium]MQG25798.1 2-oxoacid:ferredoxin oxidoreductase subunit beta [SAR202 cluster bacterium]MQG35829.1 2-oxoacid:ferredoxin oxidoreductase subunit beta [SAR202 cluster bacterium]|tara:strand:- start:14201 stop:15067 length:867 start_codon:yes stop_codon:yes gene_type:complete